MHFGTVEASIFERQQFSWISPLAFFEKNYFGHWVLWVNYVVFDEAKNVQNIIIILQIQCHLEACELIWYLFWKSFVLHASI